VSVNETHAEATAEKYSVVVNAAKLRGFSECWRVLKPNGTLVFKWGQRDISVERVLEVIGREPLYGHITGKGHNTLWAVYVKLEGVGQ